METKRCARCREIKAIEHFPFEHNKGKRGCYCRKCKAQKDMESRRRRNEKIRNRKRYGVEAMDQQIETLIDQGAIRSDYSPKNRPTTRQEAKRRRLKYYYTGTPCKNGHLDWRRTSDTICVSCHREAEQRYRERAGD